MSFIKHSTFLGLSETEFSTFATGLVNARRTGDQRQRSVSYLQKILADDKKNLKATRVTYNAQRVLHDKQLEKLEELILDLEFDFEQEVDLFTDETLNDTQIASKLTVNNTKLFPKSPMSIFPKM